MQFPKLALAHCTLVRGPFTHTYSSPWQEDGRCVISRATSLLNEERALITIGTTRAPLTLAHSSSTTHCCRRTGEKKVETVRWRARDHARVFPVTHTTTRRHRSKVGSAVQARVSAMHSIAAIKTLAVCVAVFTVVLTPAASTPTEEGIGESSYVHPMNETALGGRNLKASFLDPTHNVTTCCLACDRTAGCVAWTGSCGAEVQACSMIV